jgi:hypothetical protein
VCRLDDPWSSDDDITSSLQGSAVLGYLTNAEFFIPSRLSGAARCAKALAHKIRQDHERRADEAARAVTGSP